MFRQACREAFNDVEAVRIVKEIAVRTFVATVGVQDGVRIQGTPKHEHIVRAIDFLKDNGYGKAPLVVEVEEGSQGSAFATGEETMECSSRPRDACSVSWPQILSNARR